MRCPISNASGSSAKGPKSSVRTRPSMLSSILMNKPKSFKSLICPLIMSPTLLAAWNACAGDSEISLTDKEIFSLSESILMILTSTSSPFL